MNGAIAGRGRMGLYMGLRCLRCGGPVRAAWPGRLVEIAGARSVERVASPGGAVQPERTGRPGRGRRPGGSQARWQSRSRHPRHEPIWLAGLRVARGFRARNGLQSSVMSDTKRLDGLVVVTASASYWAVRYQDNAPRSS